jgi:hypothetical protein
MNVQVGDLIRNLSYFSSFVFLAAITLQSRGPTGSCFNSHYNDAASSSLACTDTKPHASPSNSKKQHWCSLLMRCLTPFTSVGTAQFFPTSIG